MLLEQATLDEQNLAGRYVDVAGQGARAQVVGPGSLDMALLAALPEGLDPRLAPVKVAVLPLSRNADLSPKAKDLAMQLRSAGWNVDFDDSGAIGRRYRRQDEIGTPYCVTVDFETLEDDAVTVRERDTMAQERISLDRAVAYFAERFVGC